MSSKESSFIYDFLQTKQSILGDFNKEQEAFVKGNQKNSDAAVPPWVGCANEEALKEECLSLSTVSYEKCFINIEG